MDNHSDSAVPAENADSVLESLLELCDEDDLEETEGLEEETENTVDEDIFEEYFYSNQHWSEVNEMPWREEQEPPEVINLNESGYNLNKFGSFSYRHTSGSLPESEGDSFCLVTIQDMAECYTLAAECYPESFTNERDFWVKAVEESEAYWQQIENSINEHTTINDLIAAGIIKASEAEHTIIAATSCDPSRIILRRVVDEGNFKKMRLSFDKERLCVNGAPTRISEQDVQDLYNGLFGLRSYQYAMDEVVKTLVDKLTILFGVNHEESLVEETSSEDE